MSIGSNRTLLGGGLALGLFVWIAQAQLSTISDPPPPVVAVRVRAPAEIVSGAPATYRLIVENTSRSAAHHVLLKVALPANVGLVKSTPKADTEPPQLSWKFGSLEPGEKREVSLVLKPTTDDDVEVCGRVQFEHGQCVRSRITRSGLDVKRTGPTFASVGPPLSYSLEVVNNGRAAAKNVTVEEVLPAGVDYGSSVPPIKGEPPFLWKLGDLAPGQRKTIRYEVFPKQEGEHKIRTLLRAEGVQSERTAPLTVGISPLAVVITGPCQAVVGQTARYDITVHNHGKKALNRVTLSNMLPKEIELLGVTRGRLDGNTLRWDLGTLEAGKAWRGSVEVRTNYEGNYQQVLDCRAEGGLLEQGRLTTLFGKRKELSLEIVPEKTLAIVGQETVVEVKLANVSLPQEKLSVVITLPESVEVINARGPGVGKADKGVIRSQPAELEKGDSITIILQLKAKKAGLLPIRASQGRAPFLGCPPEVGRDEINRL